MRKSRMLMLLGVTVSCAFASGRTAASAEGITLPTGTAVELALVNKLDTRTAKVGDKFRTNLVPALYVDGRPTLPEGTEVEGRVVLVKSPRGGGISGVIGVEFVGIRLPGGHEKGIHGKLTSLRQNDRRRMLELAPRVSTGRHIDVVFIGQTSAGRASTLVGDAAGTQIAMELDDPLTVPLAVVHVTAVSDAEHIYVSAGRVARGPAGAE